MMTTSRPLRFDRVVTSRHFSFIRLLNSLREWQEVIQPVYIRESPRCCIMISFCIAKATRSNSTFEVGAPTVIFRRRCVFRCCAALCSPRSRSRNLINTILFPAASASGLAYFAYTASSMYVYSNSMLRSYHRPNKLILCCKVVQQSLHEQRPLRL